MCCYKIYSAFDGFKKNKKQKQDVFSMNSNQLLFFKQFSTEK